MNSGSDHQPERFVPRFRGRSANAPRFLLLDHQSRNDATGFQQNADAGKLVHGLLGWDKIGHRKHGALPGARPSLASKPEPEARMWMMEGIAGGIQPWWHMVGAFHDDRRMYRTPAPIFQWHKQHQQYLGESHAGLPPSG